MFAKLTTLALESGYTRPNKDQHTEVFVQELQEIHQAQQWHQQPVDLSNQSSFLISGKRRSINIVQEGQCRVDGFWCFFRRSRDLGSHRLAALKLRLHCMWSEQYVQTTALAKIVQMHLLVSWRPGNRFL